MTSIAIRAVVGARVSVVKGLEKTSHLTQREAGVRHAEQQKWEVVGFTAYVVGTASRSHAAEAENPWPVTLVAPIEPGKYFLTSGFHDHGDYWGGATHTGLDFAALADTPVRSVADGTVTSVTRGGPYGIRVEVTHADGTITSYSHLRATAEHGRLGTDVKKGQSVGYEGSTGNSTGPHLHFEVMKSGKFVNPLHFLYGGGVSA